MTAERWMPVPRFEELYHVSSMGRVKRIGAASGAVVGRILSPAQATTGYVVANLWNGKQTQVLVHRAVLEAFRGPCPPGMVCRHMNGIPSDNRLSNLRWGTHAENAQDRRRHGTQQLGAHVVTAKLTARDVEQIRIRFSKGQTTKTQLGQEFGVTRTQIYHIVTGKQWVS